MEKFDTIDIFFIAIISAYFVTLICIGMALIILKIKNHKTSKKEANIKSEKAPKSKTKEAKKVINNKIVESNKKEPKFKLSNITIIRKLFMKEFNSKEEIKEKQELVVLKTNENKVKVNMEEKNSTPKPKTVTKKTNKKTPGKTKLSIEKGTTKRTVNKKGAKVNKTKKETNETTNKDIKKEIKITKPKTTTKKKVEKDIATTKNTTKTKKIDGASKPKTTAKKRNTTKKTTVNKSSSNKNNKTNTSKTSTTKSATKKTSQNKSTSKSSVK